MDLTYCSWTNFIDKAYTNSDFCVSNERKKNFDDGIKIKFCRILRTIISQNLIFQRFISVDLSCSIFGWNNGHKSVDKLSKCNQMKKSIIFGINFTKLYFYWFIFVRTMRGCLLQKWQLREGNNFDFSLHIKKSKQSPY